MSAYIPTNVISIMTARYSLSQASSTRYQTRNQRWYISSRVEATPSQVNEKGGRTLKVDRHSTVSWRPLEVRLGPWTLPPWQCLTRGQRTWRYKTEPVFAGKVEEQVAIIYWAPGASEDVPVHKVKLLRMTSWPSCVTIPVMC